MLLALLGGHAGVVELLLESGVNIESALSEQGETPLHTAVRIGNMQLVQMLLKRGARVNCVSRPGLTPLHESARHGDREIVALLLENGADLDATEPQKK